MEDRIRLLSIPQKSSYSLLEYCSRAKHLTYTIWSQKHFEVGLYYKLYATDLIS